MESNYDLEVKIEKAEANTLEELAEKIRKVERGQKKPIKEQKIISYVIFYF